MLIRKLKDIQMIHWWVDMQTSHSKKPAGRVPTTTKKIQFSKKMSRIYIDCYMVAVLKAPFLSDDDALRCRPETAAEVTPVAVESAWRSRTTFSKQKKCLSYFFLTTKKIIPGRERVRACLKRMEPQKTPTSRPLINQLGSFINGINKLLGGDSWYLPIFQQARKKSASHLIFQNDDNVSETDYHRHELPLIANWLDEITFFIRFCKATFGPAMIGRCFRLLYCVFLYFA